MKNLERAQRSWGTSLPGWVAKLAKRCDEQNQGDVARACGYSTAAINQVLANKYQGSMKNVEKAAVAYLTDKTVQCPVLGDIPRAHCQRQQRQPFNNSNHRMVRLYKACHGGCPHASREE